MDPLTALTNLVTALTTLVTTVMDGQTPEQKKMLWDWYLADVTRWRTWFKLDDGPRD